jgi:hypothetical protein
MSVRLDTAHRLRFFQSQRWKDGIGFATRCEARKPLAVTYKGLVTTFGQGRERMFLKDLVSMNLSSLHN